MWGLRSRASEEGVPPKGSRGRRIGLTIRLAWSEEILVAIGKLLLQLWVFPREESDEKGGSFLEAMQTFRCTSCGQLLFFESNSCIRCGHLLGFSVHDYEVVTLEQVDDTKLEAQVFRDLAQRSLGAGYRLCENTTKYNACNWLVPADDDNDYCPSCRLTELLPPLSDVQSRRQWVRVEAAKRRLLYSLVGLGLPLASRAENPDSGLAFRFAKSTKQYPVVTGHARGVITLNMSEADAAFRENAREKLGEGYRTVLGHLRHECGHYFWDLLVLPSKQWLSQVRELFGDDRLDYQESIARHYAEGPPGNWHHHYISAYASMHPWEDWAETWAHYLHMVDTLETAESYEVAVRTPVAIGGPSRARSHLRQHDDFEKLFNDWYSLTFVLNGLSRSMGMPDPYPFAPSETVKKKLRLVHDFLQSVGGQQSAGWFVH